MEIKATIEEVSYDKLSDEYKRLLDEAEKQMNENPYNPYSRFSVGAAAMTIDGEIFGGANFENAAYSNTSHAEQTTLYHAGSHGKRKIKAIAVIGKGKNKLDKPVTPCGMCRQAIYEVSQVSGVDTEVVMSNTDKTLVYIVKISELLPMAFGPRDVGIDVGKY